MTTKVYREDKGSGHLVPVEQVARPQARMPEVVKALESFVEQAGVEDRCLLTPAQAEALAGAVRQGLEVGLLRAERDELLAWKRARLEQDRVDAARQQQPGVTVTVATAGQVATYSLANGISRFPGSDGIGEPAHAIGAALLQVAVRELAGMGRPDTQAGRSGAQTPRG